MNDEMRTISERQHVTADVKYNASKLYNSFDENKGTLWIAIGSNRTHAIHCKSSMTFDVTLDRIIVAP